ncbi:glycoside hydrolase family 30 protein beta-glucosidase xylosidase [Plasmopara halstedii]|uniref:Glycoside hydrolase family 30 protein beta-glucosidase xylosidase n=1 Tax=Plasmopara halstedii TaxID=4781 RepID=A0A0N7L536_PLAHL|nr:glycoside hydrolase family 30 protein beta-glucosidase xylosidase [Plasmopara halstedii]CEG40379.1 glycoside hydrolase family 30 protein beta-glucosidase xylosidase [Plasmopara halstedii]|eukprot:XP_024576748.1 glycoside hydrolase family 30 protein beta-glucosidase xylosidase [Plasmopara halstedii]
MLDLFRLHAFVGLLFTFQEVSAICSSWSNRYQTNLKGVCVCNETQCDTVSNDFQNLVYGQIGIYTTSKAGDRFKYKVVSVDVIASSNPTFVIDVTTQYQKMIGFGGSFTDAAAINIYKLSSTLQQMVLDQYYSEKGLQYSLGRVPIGSTDFSTSIYSYNDNADDLAQEHFSIDVDRKLNKIALIQRALRTSKRSIKLFASSWAPPAWMTTQNTTINCALKGHPGEAYWQSLALYYSKFFDAYKTEGIDFWAMTVQNEPIRSILQMSAWQSLRMSDSVQRDFVKLNLGPTMSTNHPKLKIIAGDDQKSGILDTLAPFKDADSLKYISGLGVHWYSNLDFFLAEMSGDFTKLSAFHKRFPEVFMLATEACEGFLPSWLGTGSGPSLQDDKKSWNRAENYGRDIIEDINNFISGWTDWNLVLNSKGGPNWAQNFVDAPILVDEDTGAEFYKQPIFYIMGHFSKFVPFGSRRIKVSNTKTLSFVHRTAFVTPDNRVVMQFLNRGDVDVTVSVKQTDAKTFRLKLSKHSMKTVILPASDDTKIRI